jgi:hypothetical protein
MRSPPVNAEKVATWQRMLMEIMRNFGDVRIQVFDVGDAASNRRLGIMDTLRTIQNASLEKMEEMAGQLEALAEEWGVPASLKNRQ